jgi:hypothetical protein
MRWLLLIACGLFLWPTPTAFGYTVIRLNNGGSTTWNSVPVKYTISTSLMSDMTTSEIKAAVDDAFNTWKNVSCSKATFSNQGLKSWDPNNGIHITFKENSWDPAVGDALAYSVSQYTNSGAIKSNDVVVNAKDSEWGSTGAWGVNDLQGVLTHEIGHSLGLDHSRDFEATMFFSGGGLKLRDLEADDERGLCFLYPQGTFTQGLPCDACNAASECKFGYCWGVGGGHAYCGANCVTTSQCDAGYECASLDSTVAKQCWPTNGFCHQAGGNIPMGEECYGHAVCATGLCLSMSTKAICSKQCTSSATCGAGSSCSNGFCLPAGSHAYGASCQADEECETAMCVTFAIGKSLCTMTCGSLGGSCPAGHQCLNDQICVPPGPGPNGTPCGLDMQCLGTYCRDNSCTQLCAGSAPCPAGTGCVGGFCEGSATGGSCETAQGCPPGMLCQTEAAGASGSCQYDCNPLGGFGCPDTQVCKWRWESWTQSITGRCVAKNGGQQAGESCDSLPCENDLVCDAQFGPSAVCRKDCKNDTANDLSDPLRGLCVNEADDPPPPPDLGEGANDTSAADAGSHVVPADGGGADQSGAEPVTVGGGQTPAPEDTGCTSGQGRAFPAITLLIALLLLLRRRSTPRPTQEA